MMHPAIARLQALGIAHQRLVVDSRKIRPGDVFVAYPGAAVDGRDFIAKAVAAGASAIIAQAGRNAEISVNVPVIYVENLSQTLGHVADDFYGQASSAMPVMGVTGTNGKTTVATWLAQAHNSLGKHCGFIGTVGAGFLDRLQDTHNTTPDAATVHETIASLRASNAQAVAMEVSSHALDQGRVAGVRFECAVFTNLTQDHLDYHKTMDKYGEAKAKLFSDYPVRHRIINVDDAFGLQLASRRFPNTVTYGLNSGLVRGRIMSAERDGLQMVIESPWGEVRARIATTGTFNAYNATAVAASLLAMSFDREAVSSALDALRPAAGRLQRVRTNTVNAPCVYVDYAHTPDALSKAIDAVRESCTGRLWVVFGCGGNRDRTKRPQMGEIAAKQADCVIVTSDNPRHEAPEAIVNDIVHTLDVAQKKFVHIELNRKRAINDAIAQAKLEDVVLIAGKGHEDYQEIGGARHHFSDVEVAVEALALRQSQQERTDVAH